MSKSTAQINKALADISQVFEQAALSDREDAATILVEHICKARGKSIVCYGVGREGLMMKGFAMRLYHLGLSSAVVGDMTCPPIGDGDLLIASAGPGTFSTVEALMEVASRAKALCLLITAQPEGRAAKMADAIAILPAQTMSDDLAGVASKVKKLSMEDYGMGGTGQSAGIKRAPILPMGSVYEGALFMLFEIVVLQLRERLGETSVSMRDRHTNLE